MSELKLPELGEGIETVDVSAVLVGEGDMIRRDQPVIEVETEKASLEVPASEGGQVVSLRVKAGDQLKVGEVILEVREGDGDASGGDSPSEPKQEAEPSAAEAPEPEAKAEPETKAEPEAEEEEEPEPESESEPKAETASAAGPAVRPPAATEASDADAPAITVPAAPSARRLARKVGVDITEVRGTGPGGRISRDDVKAHAKHLIQGGGGGGGGPMAQPALPDFSQYGAVRREPLTNIRRATAKGMATAWSLVPHVTQFDTADITQLESMRKRFNASPQAADRKLTMTAIVIKMVGSVLRQFPKFNASLDLVGEAVIYKDYVNIGCAVDTDRGLLVPVLRDVDKKNLVQVAVELNDLADRARKKKLKPDEMRGACFTVSNLGGLGTTHFSPIVNWPEVAILGVGRAEQRAVFEDGQFRPRLMMPLSLSYDHRLIDGADAARFTRRVAEALEQPLLLLLDD